MKVWRQVVGFEGYYEVSDCGDVRSIERILPPDSLGRVLTRKGKTLAQSCSSGYMRVPLSLNGRMQMHSVHRLVLKAFKGECPDGMEGCHNDNNVENNHLENLRWDTFKNNQADRELNNTDVKGENNGRAKLTNVQAEEVKHLLKSGVSSLDIQEKFEISKYIVSGIKTGKTWNKDRK